MPKVSSKKKKELVDRIKHGIKKYRFSIQRYGGETTMGIITPYQYHYWKNHQEELTEYLMGGERSEYEVANNVPEEARFKSDWYEFDDVAHCCGALIEGNFLNIDEYDQHGNAIKDEKGHYVFHEPIELIFDNIDKLGIQFEDQECIDLDHDAVENQYYLWGDTGNKGSWSVEEDIAIEGELDFSKLKLHTKCIEGSDICYAISYGDGAAINLQEDSIGSSQECQVREGYRNEKTMSKKMKQEIARAEAEASRSDADTEEEDADELPAPSVEEPMTMTKKPAVSMKSGKKKKVKAKNKAKKKKLLVKDKCHSDKSHTYDELDY